jgi:hypothetical protein
MCYRAQPFDDVAAPLCVFARAARAVRAMMFGYPAPDFESGDAPRLDARRDASPGRPRLMAPTATAGRT